MSKVQSVYVSHSAAFRSVLGGNEKVIGETQIEINLQKGITFNKVSVSSFADFEQMKDRPISLY